MLIQNLIIKNFKPPLKTCKTKNHSFVRLKLRKSHVHTRNYKSNTNKTEIVMYLTKEKKIKQNMWHQTK